MTDSRTDFDARLRVLGRKHRAMANGVKRQVRKDGLIVVRPTRKRIRKQGVRPLRILVMLLFGFFALKGFLLASIGEAAYEQRLASLSEGTQLERAGAIVMQPDRVSILFASAFGNLTQE